MKCNAMLYYARSFVLRMMQCGSGGDADMHAIVCLRAVVEHACRRMQTHNHVVTKDICIEYGESAETI
jgi:hypothetical protein